MPQFGPEIILLFFRPGPDFRPNFRPDIAYTIFGWWNRNCSGKGILSLDLRTWPRPEMVKNNFRPEKSGNYLAGNPENLWYTRGWIVVSSALLAWRLPRAAPIRPLAILSRLRSGRCLSILRVLRLQSNKSVSPWQSICGGWVFAFES